ncbi:Oleate-activated transcription factor 1 [Smittium culicis]|uniref:Oleate-activated transcription factor 1 n=1 Tax=Smittium culicis TaxID=133412 RepID=A0A1R1Y7A0_9FUNG|nr:Oleate-activated transcription factor 1 [Smittium culicis]
MVTTENINSRLEPFKAIKKGKSFFSCQVCRKKKVKCDSVRPRCGTCITYDRKCNYEENETNEKLSKEVENSELSLFLSKFALGFGYIDVGDDIIIKIVKKLPPGSILSIALSRDYIISRLKNKTLPEHMKLSILAIGSKIFDSHSLFNNHLYMCGSTYAEKAYQILIDEMDKPSLDKIFSALTLVIHYGAISKISRTIFLIGLATKYAYMLRLNKMDASKYKTVNCNQDWIFQEYKRRIWWYLYVRNVIVDLSYGTANKISPKDMAVNLPSNDYYFNNYNSDPYLKNYKLNFNSNDSKGGERDERDEQYILIQAYIELGMASDFVNRSRIRLSNLPNEYRSQLLHAKKRILDFEDFLRAHYSYLDIDKDTLLPNCSPSDAFKNNKFTIFFSRPYST